MKLFLASCLLALVAVCSVAAQPPNKDCFENRPKVRPGECCTGVTKMIDATALAKCKAKYPEPTPPANAPTNGPDGKGHRHGPMGGSCVIGCYLNETLVYNKNGVLDKTAALSVLGKNLDATMKKALATSLDTCLAKQKEFKDKFGGADGPKPPQGDDSKRPPMPDNMPKCSHEPAFLVRCVEMDLYKNCPAANKVASDDCKALATFIDKCRPEKKN